MASIKIHFGFLRIALRDKNCMIYVGLKGVSHLVNFMTGVNFGGWISQYRKLDYAIFRKQTTRDDVHKVQSWGFDHIRLPFDYPLLLDEGDLYTFKPEGIAFLDNMVSWCRDAGMSLLLDLHWAPGYRFQDIGHNAMFDSPELLKVFTALWTQIARRYKDAGEFLAFDLLNEVAEAEYMDAWVELAQGTIRAIRSISPERDMIYGGAYHNSVHMLERLPIMEDDHVIYNFHYYEPILFTHQFASWNKINMDYMHQQEYPADYKDLRKFAAEHPQYERSLSRYMDMRCDREAVKRDLALAGAFKQKTGKMAYCGEYGVYEKASLASKLNWMRDVTEFLNQYRIGRALWNYQGIGFGLYDWEKQVETDPEVVRIITQTW
jgi:hypothetical protein